MRLVPIGRIRDPDVGASNRLDTRTARGLIEANETERVAEIRQRERALAVFRGSSDRVIEADDTVCDRIFGVEAEMNKTRF